MRDQDSILAAADDTGFYIFVALSLVADGIGLVRSAARDARRGFDDPDKLPIEARFVMGVEKIVTGTAVLPIVTLAGGYWIMRAAARKLRRSR